jgi:hypothetical protein
MPKNKEPISEKEQRLLDAVKALNPKELEAYKFFVKENQIQISEEVSDHLFELFCNGSSCDDIRRTVKSYSFGQIVACRVMGDWDKRKLEKQLAIKTIVPEQNPITLLESQEFLGDLIVATSRKYSKQLKGFIATNDERLLEGLPIPRNMKDYAILLESFMKASGQDEVKKVVHSGNINLTPAVSPVTIKEEEDNEKTLDELLGIEVVDVEFEEIPKKQLTDGKE